MAISDKDRAFMNEVAAYFRMTKDDVNPEGSLRDTALQFDISRNKVRKILITTGDIHSDITDEAVKLQKEGLSIQEIAKNMNLSSATVSVYLPYTDVLKDSLDPSDHAKAVREYRENEKKQAERQVQNMETDRSWKDEWKKEIALSFRQNKSRPARLSWKEYGKKDALGIDSLLNEKDDRVSERYGRNVEFYPGMLCDRSISDLERISGDQIPLDPSGVLRLHMELMGDLNEEDKTILKKYGDLKYGDCISRDVVIPEDMPLYAIHYMIQRLFGWQNSHLHRFEFDKDLFDRLTEDNTALWYELVGILFRSPFMDEYDEFWADDYERGSFKNWLTKKYTGPYMSQCHGEGLIACKQSMNWFYKELVNDEMYYVVYEDFKGKQRAVIATPVYDHKGNKREEPKWNVGLGKEWVEVKRLSEVPLHALMFERGCRDLLERLPLNRLISQDAKEASGRQLIRSCKRMKDHILENEIDTPLIQVYPEPICDELYYYYDFGDGWKIRIKVMNDCKDLIEQKRVTQEQIDMAQIKCRELYRPVTLAVDGEMLMDDVGGIFGFIDFLKTINEVSDDLDEYDERSLKQEKKDWLSWAKNVQSWKKLSPYI